MGFARPPAVAGMFYPAEAGELRREVASLLAAAAPPPDAAAPKAIIAPHAGYVFSGPVAAKAYARLAPLRGEVARVVLIGPAHRVSFRGLAVSAAESFATPLGPIPIDRDAVARLLALPGTSALDSAHAQEHSLEVHLPFLQTVLGHFSLVPIVAGLASAEQVARALETLWGGRETLIVVSSDLSHYLDYDSARAMDAGTRAAIERLDSAPIGFDQACGRIPIAGLLDIARRRGLAVETVDLRNSGDTAGPRDRVVGYGAWAFTEPGAGAAKPGSANEADIRAHGPMMLALAWDAIAGKLRHGQAPALPDGFPPLLAAPGASFVTLKREARLRGCIGSAVAWRPLGEDVAGNALRAAFEDPRFEPLKVEELDGLRLSVSVLTPQEPMRFSGEADLLAQLRPRRDGLFIEDGERRALFLPSVWEQIPEPRAFLLHLKAKAGLPPAHWSESFRARRFAAVEIGPAQE